MHGWQIVGGVSVGESMFSPILACQTRHGTQEPTGQAVFRLTYLLAQSGSPAVLHTWISDMGCMMSECSESGKEMLFELLLMYVAFLGALGAGCSDAAITDEFWNKCNFKKAKYEILQFEGGGWSAVVHAGVLPSLVKRMRSTICAVQSESAPPHRLEITDFDIKNFLVLSDYACYHHAESKECIKEAGGLISVWCNRMN